MVKPTREQLNIRKMSVEDVPKVFDIERNSFSHSSWSIDAFYHEIENNEFVKYAMNYARFSCDVMSLEVRIDNDVAQHVYRNLGFQNGGKRKNYYGEGEDALVMWVNLK